MEVKIRIKVFGKVQGVFFRKATQEMAQQLRLTGTVQNLADGSVFICAQGAEPNVSKLIEWCHHGPDRAEVSKVVTEECDQENLSDFKILS